MQNSAHNDEAVKFYTGLPNYDVVMALFGYLRPMVYEPFGRAQKMALEDEFLAILMRLRLGFWNQDLVDRLFTFNYVNNVCEMDWCDESRL